MPWDSAIPNVLAGDASPLAGDPSVPAPQALTSMDNEAFAAFYERSARPLWAYLARVSGDPALADDLLQEAFIRFLTADHAPGYLTDGEVSQRRYLFRIATNLLRDHWRRPRASSLDQLPDDLLRVPDNSASAESRALLGPALQALRPRDRQLLWLAYAEGYSHHEIAAITGLASASIRLLLFRARRRVAALLRASNTSQSRRPQ